jgi:hypothetical protein
MQFLTSFLGTVPGCPVASDGLSNMQRQAHQNLPSTPHRLHRLLLLMIDRIQSPHRAVLMPVMPVCVSQHHKRGRLPCLRGLEQKST